MESVLDKKVLQKQIRNDLRLDSNRKIKETEAFQTGAVIIALIEIREAIEEGFAKIDQTAVEGAMMFVGCKETLDSFLESRLETDKVLIDIAASMEATKAKPEAPVEKAAEVALAVIAAANESKDPEKTEKPDTPAAEENNSSDTLNLGDAGIVPPLSEEA